jgi:hypothetical protein
MVRAGVPAVPVVARRDAGHNLDETPATTAARRRLQYNHILGNLVTMILHPENWVIRH